MNSDIAHEAESILRLKGGSLDGAFCLLNEQLNVLQTRSQVLLSLAGVTITVTGFSGRLIAATSRPSQVLIVAGLALVLASAVYVYSRVMRIRWLSCLILDDAKDTMMALIRQRNCKTRAYNIGGVLLCIGLGLYCGAVAMMLIDPVAVTVPVR